MPWLANLSRAWLETCEYVFMMKLGPWNMPRKLDWAFVDWLEFTSLALIMRFNHWFHLPTPRHLSSSHSMPSLLAPPNAISPYSTLRHLLSSPTPCRLSSPHSKLSLLIPGFPSTWHKIISSFVPLATNVSPSPIKSSSVCWFCFLELRLCPVSNVFAPHLWISNTSELWKDASIGWHQG